MGPLQGVRVVEFAGIGPGPFAAMMLADMGADVLRIDRKSEASSGSPMDGNPAMNFTLRGRRSITLDLKDARAIETALRLVENADVLIEGFRPGVMERLGLGPEVCHARNPALVYGRITGWGQTGPLSSAAGHDINYIALSGALWAIGEADRDPVPPLNLLGDFAGGGMMLAYGISCALLKARLTSQGDIVDAAICDGTAALMTPLYGYLARGAWQPERHANSLDGAAPFYGVYKCADGKWISIAPLEEKFWSLFLDLMEFDPEEIGDRLDRTMWPKQRARFEEIFARKPRQAWCDLLEGTDICFAPVLDILEAPHHPHNRARKIFVEVDGIQQPAPAPRFANSVTGAPSAPRAPGADNATALQDWGFSDEEVAELASSGIL